MASSGWLKSEHQLSALPPSVLGISSCSVVINVILLHPQLMLQIPGRHGCRDDDLMVIYF